MDQNNFEYGRFLCSVVYVNIRLSRHEQVQTGLKPDFFGLFWRG